MTKKTNEPSGWNPVFEFPLDDRNTIIIDGIKYQKVEEPKPPTLYDALCEKGGMYSSVCDTVIKIVSEWLPLEGCHELKSYDYSDGWNDCIKYLKTRLRE
jgi:hypothetical protein